MEPTTVAALEAILNAIVARKVGMREGRVEYVANIYEEKARAIVLIWDQNFEIVLREVG